MAFDFKFPDVGEGVHEGKLVKWLLKEGASVKTDESVAEVETDKAVVEIPSPRAGVVLKEYFKEGDTIKVGDVLFTIGDEGEKLTPTPAAAPAIASLPRATPIVPSPPTSATSRLPVLASPSVRALARQLKVDLNAVTPSSASGRVTEDDVKRTANTPRATPPTAAPQPSTAIAPAAIPITIDGPVERVPLSALRKTIANRLTAGWQSIPMVTHVDECDVTDLWALRQREKEAAESRGVKLTFLPFILKASVEALKKFPHFNASLDATTNEIVVKKYYHLGVAVDTSDGLLVPVVRDADRKTITQVAQEIQVLAERARNRTASLGELRGSSFTITNIGSAGGLFATPLINPPETAILGVYRIRDAPRVRDGKIEARKTLTLSVTFDHRVVDGTQAALFLNEIMRHLEEPQTALADAI